MAIAGEIISLIVEVGRVGLSKINNGQALGARILALVERLGYNGLGKDCSGLAVVESGCYVESLTEVIIYFVVNFFYYS